MKNNSPYRLKKRLAQFGKNLFCGMTAEAFKIKGDHLS